jgi:hypothetical protein
VARKLWKTDDELFTIVKKELFTCVVGDVMDKMRLQHQFLPPCGEKLVKKALEAGSSAVAAFEKHGIM